MKHHVFTMYPTSVKQQLRLDIESDILIIVELGVFPSAWQLSMNYMPCAVINESTVSQIWDNAQKIFAYYMLFRR